MSNLQWSAHCMWWLSGPDLRARWGNALPPILCGDRAKRGTLPWPISPAEAAKKEGFSDANGKSYDILLVPPCWIRFKFFLLKTNIHVKTRTIGANSKKKKLASMKEGCSTIHKMKTIETGLSLQSWPPTSNWNIFGGVVWKGLPWSQFQPMSFGTLKHIMVLKTYLTFMYGNLNPPTDSFGPQIMLVRHSRRQNLLGH